ncbi:MAG: cation transporter [Alphaproteobacteria bacterium]|nr:cation transporter [Alphaproteobacteria bacterium]
MAQFHDHDHDHGHGHGHAHAATCCEIDPAQSARFRNVLWIVLAINFAMFVIEAGAGIGAESVSLQADALDFLGDSANYAISLLVLGMGARWRTGAALIKGSAMGLFGCWVIGATVWSLVYEGRPSAVVMGSVGLLALAANVVSAFLLYRFREGDANMRSVWLCSRNDAIGNLAVVGAASGVFATGSNLPDLGVAAIMAGLALFAAFRVLDHAAREWRHQSELHRGGHPG